MKKEIIVIKIGTSSITLDNGELDENFIEDISFQISELNKKYRLVLVSSGAVGCGKSFISNYTGKLNEKKAAAAIGNPILMHHYIKSFNKQNVMVAQSLCERQHFSNRKQFLQLRETFETLWKHNIIPIVNENDVVNNIELKFSDNDELATLISVGFGAKRLLIGTTVDGVLDKSNVLIPQIEHFNSDILSLARKETSLMGMGGMASKLAFASLATSLGIEVIIFKTRKKNSIIRAFNHEIGTICPAKLTTKNARQKWLASGSLVHGQIKIDDGAEKALQNRKSLLAVGILSVDVGFEKNEVFQIKNNKNELIAIASSKIASVDIKLNTKDLEVANANEIIIL